MKSTGSNAQLVSKVTEDFCVNQNFRCTLPPTQPCLKNASIHPVQKKILHGISPTVCLLSYSITIPRKILWGYLLYPVLLSKRAMDVAHNLTETLQSEVPGVLK